MSSKFVQIKTSWPNIQLLFYPIVWCSSAQLLDLFCFIWSLYQFGHRPLNRLPFITSWMIFFFSIPSVLMVWPNNFCMFLYIHGSNCSLSLIFNCFRHNAFLHTMSLQKHVWVFKLHYDICIEIYTTNYCIVIIFW